MKVWYSKEGGPWREIDVSLASIVGQALAQMKRNAVYDDGYGNRYRGEKPDEAAS